jgi:hypothetical protein
VLFIVFQAQRFCLMENDNFLENMDEDGDVPAPQNADQVNQPHFLELMSVHTLFFASQGFCLAPNCLRT